MFTKLKKIFSFVGAKRIMKEKSFDDIPGPFSLPFIGTAWKYFPIIGSFDPLRLHVASNYLYKTYGSVVKEKIGTFNMVHLYDPNHFKTIYKLCSENNIHVRRGFHVVKKYRMSKPHVYKSSGLLPNNSNWYEVRKDNITQIFSIKGVRDYLVNDDTIVKEFVDKIGKKETVDNFQELAIRLNTELTLMFLFGKRFNIFSEDALHPDSYLSQLLKTITYLSEAIGYFDRESLFMTKTDIFDYEKLLRSLYLTEKFVLEEIEKIKTKRNDSKKCLISEYLKVKDPDQIDVGLIIDILYGGIDTTAIISSYLLYEVSRNEKVQESLREEASRLLPRGNNSQITEETLSQARNTKAVVKETLRLHPIISAQNRKIPKSVNLSGFDIPKNTLVLLEFHTACRLEDNFKDANKFNPERWIKSSDQYKESNPYIMLPFGLGLRTCIGRRRAEQLIQILVLRIFNEYKLKTDVEDLGTLTPFLKIPENPLKIELEKINDY